jgi:hypothetical protein
VAIDSAQIQAYANAFVPYFYFDQNETVFPVSVDSWLEQCAAGDWQDPTDPHRGTTVVTAPTPLTTPGQLNASGGCMGSAGTPLTTTQPLPIPHGYKEGEELFLDFAGWAGLQTGTGFAEGDDTFIQAFYSPWFTSLNSGLSPDPGSAPQRPGTIDTLPTELELYCEAAWAGEFTRLCIQQGCTDFAPAPTLDPANLEPDPLLDLYFVLTYYLFYPCTEPPPGNPNLRPGSPNLNHREGQWEAVSFYFNAANPETNNLAAADLTLPQSPAGVVPSFAVISQGIVASGDGRDTAGLQANYPAQCNTTAGVTMSTHPLAVFVTCGTHKNLFRPTPVVTTSNPDQGGLVAGGAEEQGGGIVAGAGGAIAALGGSTAWTGWGLLLLIIGLIIYLIGIAESASAAGHETTTPVPDSQGDSARGGPVAGGPSGGAGSAWPPSAVGANPTIFASSALAAQPAQPAWWQFPGRWGVAVGPDPTDWDSGGFLTDFKARTRAYWNTVALQGAL